MICFPNAKINLGLHIVSRRADGYHNIETIFYPIGLNDGLEIVPICNSRLKSSIQSIGDTPDSKKRERLGIVRQIYESANRFRFFQYGKTLTKNVAENLVIKAFDLVSAEKKIAEIDIHLFKKIPIGSGLGGGSSDAAFMLNLLNEKFKLNYSIKELTRIAAKIGADSPFFLFNRPAFATGIGDIVEPVKLDLSKLFILLVSPDIMIPTKEAYSMITPRKPELSLKEIVKKPLYLWREQLKNDFETPIFKKYPEICKIKRELYDIGAQYASMSGSGSSVFGLFEKQPNWNREFENCFVWCQKPV